MIKQHKGLVGGFLSWLILWPYLLTFLLGVGVATSAQADDQATTELQVITGTITVTTSTLSTSFSGSVSNDQINALVNSAGITDSSIPATFACKLNGITYYVASSARCDELTKSGNGQTFNFQVYDNSANQANVSYHQRYCPDSIGGLTLVQVVPTAPCPQPENVTPLPPDPPNQVPSANYIQQDLRMPLMDTFQANAVRAVRESHNLSAADDTIIMDSARNEVRSLVFSQLVQLAKQPTWSSEEQAIMDFYAKSIKANRLKGDDFALEQFYEWSSSICEVGPGQSLNGTGWKPPAGFNYDWTTMSIPQCKSLFKFSPPAAPSFTDFQNYGKNYVYQQFLIDQNSAKMAAETALSSTFSSTLNVNQTAIDAGAASFAIALSPAPELLGALSIWASMEASLAKLVVTATGEVINVTTPVLDGLAIFSKIAGPALIIITATLMAISQALLVFDNLKLPEQLKNQKNVDNIAPDLRTVVSTPAGVQEFFMAYIQGSLPEFGPTLTPPPSTFDDLQFVLVESSGSGFVDDGVSPTLHVKSPVAGVTTEVRTSGKWLATTMIVNGKRQPERYSTSFSYVNWEGVNMIAWRVGDTFVHTPAHQNTPEGGYASNNIQYQDPDSSNKLFATFTSNEPDILSWISADIAGTLGNNDWYTSPVNLTWTPHLFLNQVLLGKQGCDPVQINKSGKYAYTCSMKTDNGVNSLTKIINVDTVAPTIKQNTLLSAPNTWVNNLSLTFSCTDNASGVASCPDTTPNLPEGAAQVFGPYQATDAAGNTSSYSTPPVNIDYTPPEVHRKITPAAPNNNNWFNSDVIVDFGFSDKLSGLLNATAPIAVTGEGADQLVTGSATDLAGNSIKADIVVNIDKTPPNVTWYAYGASNAQNWHNQPVQIDVRATDNLSGVYPWSDMHQLFLVDEAHSNGFPIRAADMAGNVTTIYGLVNIDMTPPNVTGTIVKTPAAPGRNFYTPLPANAYGWYNQDVAVQFSCDDAKAGVAFCTYGDKVMGYRYLENPQTGYYVYPPVVISPLEWQYGPIVVSSEGFNQPVTGFSTDLADNGGSTTVRVSIDKTPPTCAVGFTPKGVLNSTGGMANVTATVSMADSLSGAASFKLLGISGGDTAADVSGFSDGVTGQLATRLNADGTPRVYTFTYQVKDKADNSNTCSGTVTVAPDIDGDGVTDSLDDCTLVANANQLDSDGDQFGNACDADFNGNNVVDPSDLSAIKAKLGKPAANFDLNGNGIVDPSDISLAKSYLGKAPGPSGLVH